MKKVNGAASAGQKSLLSFFTKAPTPTPVASKAPEKEFLPKEIVQIDVVKTPSGLTGLDSVSTKESANDEMDVDDVVVKKRGVLFIFLLTPLFTQ